MVWVGSVVAIIAATALGPGSLDGADRWLMIGAARIYLFGVQLPTFVINIPLNNQLHSLGIDALSESGQASIRAGFEPRWNRSNIVRTLLPCLVSLLLIALLLRY